MQLVEQHVIRKADPRFAMIDQAAFASKNLYNAANYIVRQAFIHEGLYLGYAEVFHRIKDHEAYYALPRKVSNDVLRQLDRNWRASSRRLPPGRRTRRSSWGIPSCQATRTSSRDGTSWSTTSRRSAPLRCGREKSSPPAWRHCADQANHRPAGAYRATQRLLRRGSRL